VSDFRFFQTGLPQLPTNTDSKIEPDLRDIYNAIRNLTYQIGQYGGFEASVETKQTPEEVEYSGGVYKRRMYVIASEALTYGALVNIHDVAGRTNGRFANATTSARPCHGICNTPGTAAIGATVEIALPGCITSSVGGLARGQQYFLSTVNGVMTNVAPAAVGNIRQGIGFGLDPNILFFMPDSGWFVI
jgi:hypothetical protein